MMRCTMLRLPRGLRAVSQGQSQRGCTRAVLGEPAASSSPVGPRDDSVAVGDFNLDGRPDFATANGDDNSVTIQLGDGSGNFAPPPGSPIDLAAGGPAAVAVGDFNLDGKPDLVTANAGSNDVTILLGDGLGGFTHSGAPTGGAVAHLSEPVGVLQL